MAAAQLGLLGSEFFTNIVLPFLFIFTIVFAILEKTKALGQKKDINAIVALVFGLITVGVPSAIGVVLNFIPIIVVLIVIIIAWFMTYGFVGGWEKTGVSDAWKKTFQIILGIAFIGSIAWATGAYKYIIDKPWAGQVGQTILLIGAIIAVIAIVISGKQEPAK